MKDGLDADPIRLRFSQAAYALQRTPLSPSGVRKDFQEAIANLRTDLDAFTREESYSLMACGYQMTAKAFEKDLSNLAELWDDPVSGDWPFAEVLAEITSTAAATPTREARLAALDEGRTVRI